MHKDTVFRGCTRPAMFMGVPCVPFFVVAGGVLLLAMYASFWLLLALPPAILGMRAMARRDAMVFRLLGLHLLVRLRVRNAAHRHGLWAFTPNRYRAKPP